MSPRGLGEILAEERLIGRNQLEQAQRVADRSGASLVVVLLEQGLVDEDALVQALCDHLNARLFDPADAQIDPRAIDEVPVEDANRFRLLPVQVEQRDGRRVLQVAMADPLDRHAIEEIEFSTGCIVEPLIGRPSQLAEAIRSHYRHATVQPATPDYRSGGADPFDVPIADRGTQRMRRIQQDASLSHRVDALVALLIREGVISQDEYEDQLRALQPSVMD